MTYRIFTEDVGRRADTAVLVSKYFDSFSLYPIQGYWKGQSENSIVIEVAGVDEARVHELAQAIKTAHNQQAVLIEKHETISELV